MFTWARITFQKTFQKKAVLDRDPPRKPDSRTCERKALLERDSCVCILKMRAEAMHKCMGQLARADCAVGAKYYLTVRRSWSWLGRRLQCMWTHVVQITIPITFWIAIRNVFRNVILAHVNTASDASVTPSHKTILHLSMIMRGLHTVKVEIFARLIFFAPSLERWIYRVFLIRGQQACTHKHTFWHNIRAVLFSHLTILPRNARKFPLLQ